MTVECNILLRVEGSLFVFLFVVCLMITACCSYIVMHCVSVAGMLTVGISSLQLAEFDEFNDSAPLEETKSLSEPEVNWYVTLEVVV
jgi:hypothetical protein